MLSDKYIKAIAQNRQNIVEDLIVSDIIPDLRSCKSFTLYDAEIIESKVGSKNKASTLLDILTDKDDQCFESFLEILGEVSEHLAEGLTASFNNRRRSRRLSESEFGNILISGGVPDRFADYIHRRPKENEILNELKNDSHKAILIHGELGCGKSSIVSQVLHSEGLFPQRYCRVCWMTIGKVDEKDILSKLITLYAKLESNLQNLTCQIPELYKDLITKKLRNDNILLILDDIQSSAIMAYFTFPLRYVVTSRNSRLFSADQAVVIEIPERFTYEECSKFLEEYSDDINVELMRTVIDKLNGNPMSLSMLKNLLKSNKDYIKRIGHIDVLKQVIDEILKINMDILDEEMRRCYKMLAILDVDETVSISLLAIYWNISEVDALTHINHFSDNHLISKKWVEEYKCNMYGIHNLHSNYLKLKCQNEIKPYERTLIERHINRFEDWLKFDYLDPYFFRHFAKIVTKMTNVQYLLLFYDFTFLASKIVIGGISDLLFDFKVYRPLNNYEIWDEFNSFFMRHNHIFVNLPKSNLSIKIAKVLATLIQLAFSEDKNSQIFKKAKEFQVRSRKDDFWIWENTEPSMKIWETSNIDDIDLIDINHCGILITSKSGVLSLYEIKTGIRLFYYKMFEERIIFCKFLKSENLEFLLLDAEGNVRCFDISKLLDPPQQQSTQELDDDDLDYYDQGPVIINTEVDFNMLRQQIEHVPFSDFIKKCEINTSTKLKQVQGYITGFVGMGKMSAASYVSNTSLPGNSNIDILIEWYTLDGFILNSDFKINYPVEKIIHTKTDDGRYFQVYVLREDGSRVDLYDDDGQELKTFAICNETIYDFVVFGKDIYLAVNNGIYKNQDGKPLFSTATTANIQRMSICPDNKLMALCLTNQSVQIWDIAKRALLYAIKGFDITQSLFEYCKYLITVEKSNLSKWSLVDFENDSLMNSVNKHNYRLKFIMYTRSSSSVIWILQKYTNELEFRSLENGDYRPNFIQASSKATCFSIDGDYAFIGFVSSHVQIFDLNDLSCEPVIIESVNNVNELVTFSEIDHWNIVVNYENNKIKIFRVSKSNRSIDDYGGREWDNLYKLKMFKLISDHVMIGICLKSEFNILKIDTSLKLIDLFTQSFAADTNIIDLDVNDKGEFVCAAMSNGVLMVWGIGNEWERSNDTDTLTAVRICKFRPTVQSDWNAIAAVNDNGEVRLYYFNNDEDRVNIIIEDITPTGLGIFSSMTWTDDGTYLFIGDIDIKKWKVPQQPVNRDNVKLSLTKLYTYMGGIQCVRVNKDFISTIDRGGYFYILRKS